MMLIEETNSQEIPLWIDDFDHQKIMINNIPYCFPLLLTEDQVITTSIPNLTDLSVLFFRQYFEQFKQPEILIIGTGKERVSLMPQFEVSIVNLGVGLDIMPTASACRTINLLKAERRIIWALLYK